MKKILFITISLVINVAASAQPDNFRVMFYNCENLFDTIDDPRTADEEFTPQGSRLWNGFRFHRKASNIYKVVAAVGQGTAPDMIAVCEIENRQVLEELLIRTPLRYHGYQIVHKESGDGRGIDVGLLYREDRFYLLKESFHAAQFSDNPGRKSRDILHAEGLLLNGDTLHVFVNHWPSKYGGAMATRGSRNDVARLLRHLCDSIMDRSPDAKIVITGDFNTGPDDEPVRDVLGAAVFPDTAGARLVDLTTAAVPSRYPGSIKFQGAWDCIDLFIVSKALVDSRKAATKSSAEALSIGHFDFLMEPDETYTGFKPYRTYVGFSYNGGYSDHLPTWLDIMMLDLRE